MKWSEQFIKLENLWYQPSINKVTATLLPFSWIFGLAVKLRRFFYQKKIKHTEYFSVPVIVVGNIVVGGTGKTPFVIWLAHFLRRHHFKPGIISRGVGGRRQKHPLLIDHKSDPRVVGDEALLLKERSGCPVVVCVNRKKAVTALLNSHECNIVISDDGLQHYGLARDLEIALVDEMRGLGNQHLLPAGPLRESVERLNEVDFVVYHRLKFSDANDYQMALKGDWLYSIINEKKIPVQLFAQTKIHAVAGIGNPDRFFQFLRQFGLDLIEHRFKDHYQYQTDDLLFNDSLPIVMTEKDAVKCKSFANERFWYLPVEAEVSQHLSDAILSHLSHVACVT